jgi:hypothetical protein
VIIALLFMDLSSAAAAAVVAVPDDSTGLFSVQELPPVHGSILL